MVWSQGAALVSGDDKPVAVVTGGLGFIGSAIVTALEASGHHVIAFDRAGDNPVDLADEDSVRKGARAVLAEFGRCDVLVHAGVAFERVALPDLTADVMRRVMSVNVESVLWLLQELTPAMADRGFGRVVMLISDTFWNPPPVPDMLPYIASKGALIGAARSLARTLGSDGITINCVAPGVTPSPKEDMPPEFVDAVRLRQSVPKTLVPADVANVVDFLVKPESHAITGQSLCPDGGLVFR